MKVYPRLRNCFLFLLIFSLPKCREKTENREIEEILKNQLIRGSNQYDTKIEMALSPREFSIQDLEVAANICEKILKANGFKFLEKSKFNEKIKTLFNQNIDLNAESKYTFINYVDPCDKLFKDHSSNNTHYNGTYTIIGKGFITNFYYIPELIEYEKEYPKIAKLEDTMRREYTNEDNSVIKLWKEVPNLSEQRKKNIQTIIARNMYFLNDNKTYYNWLTLNDEYFIDQLVKTFGYTEDKELLKYELNKIPEYESYPSKDIIVEFNKLLWTRDCAGKVKINQHTLDVLKEISTPEKCDLILYLSDCVEAFFRYEDDKEFYPDLSFSDKAKIIAYLLSFGEQFKYHKDYDYNQMFLGRFIYYLDYKKRFKKEFEKNNYYGLAHLKEWYKKAEKEKDISNNDKRLMDDPQPIDYLRYSH